jgi:hypothetical protein
LKSRLGRKRRAYTTGVGHLFFQQAQDPVSKTALGAELLNKTLSFFPTNSSSSGILNSGNSAIRQLLEDLKLRMTRPDSLEELRIKVDRISRKSFRDSWARDRFYETPLRPKTLRINFETQILDMFPTKNTTFKFTLISWTLILDLKYF